MIVATPVVKPVFIGILFDDSKGVLLQKFILRAGSWFASKIVTAGVSIWKLSLPT